MTTYYSRYWILFMIIPLLSRVLRSKTPAKGENPQIIETVLYCIYIFIFFNVYKYIFIVLFLYI